MQGGACIAGRPAAAAWLAIGGLLIALAGVFLAFGHRFDYVHELIDIPAVPLAIGLVIAGLVTLPLPFVVGRTVADAGADQRWLLVLMIGVGCVLRLMMFWTNPALEDDYYRYFWDGAVVVHGANPYALAPADAAEAGSGLQRLAAEAGVVMERINHADLKTVYPPVAQAAFALGTLIRPWSIAAWRAVCLAGELVTLLFLILLLRAAGRSPLWAALYWWNPVVVKELVNSAHMEAILMPLVLGALMLSARRQHVAAIAALGLAVGAKLWPVLLAPLLLRPLLATPPRLAAALALLGGLALAWIAPIYAGGLDETSGFVAYAQRWRTNSALFPVLERLAAALLSGSNLSEHTPGILVRLATALAVAALALGLARRPIADTQDLMTRSGVIVAVLFLLSPAQFPWYAVWVLPFLAFRPSPALFAVTALIPIYYVSFHYYARDEYDVFREQIVWLIWAPVWALLTWELGQRWRRSAPASPAGGRHA